MTIAQKAVNYTKGGETLQRFTRQTTPYLNDQYYLKVVGDKVKLTRLYQVKASGWEEDTQGKKKEIVNDKKQKRNLMRARETVFEYAYCNEWDYFFTGTIDGKKLNRSDLGQFEKKLTQMIRNERKKGYDIQYLIIPELHGDMENWHCHGLIKGLPEECLIHFKEDKYNWKKYSDMFGFNSLEPIRSHEAVSKYLTKYITKTFNQNKGVSEVGKKLYLCSNGLKKGDIKRKGSIAGTIERQPDFENDFCQIFNFNLSDLDWLIKLYE